MHYKCNPFPKEKAEFEILVNSTKAKETKELLEKCFNANHTPQKKLESNNLRTELIKEIRNFQNLLFDYFENNKNEICLIRIKEDLTNYSAFTAFKRWIIRDNIELMNEFGQYI